MLKTNKAVRQCSKVKFLSGSLIVLCTWTHGFEQTVQTQIRLLLKEQSDQGLHCLPFYWSILGFKPPSHSDTDHKDCTAFLKLDTRKEFVLRLYYAPARCHCI